ncbi:hypothetical protein B0H67DRAFT_568163 [Lasiosphaeris hirsuta]|uniref:Uncharacterized protein n=1 Tax=Lasiosphaeris hirsuta TaxID=260670 RepID=A0AA40AYV1_9PEZI|nr:hypothetical protein B0H67DRAFT_568163 [Lasiosphaeris hirsuta]
MKLSTLRDNNLGANIDARDQDGRTPLLWASMNGLKTVVQQLLKGGSMLMHVTK